MLERVNKFIIPRVWRLTPTEEALFILLLSREIVTLDAAMTALYSDRNDPPFDKVIDVHISNMRKKLTPHGVEIKKIHSRGWRLTDRTSFTNKAEASADERVIAYNEGYLDALDCARLLFQRHVDTAIAELFTALSDRREAYGIRSSHAMTDDEAGARALCVAIGHDPDRLVQRTDGRPEEPLWVLRLDEAKACLQAAMARPADTAPPPAKRQEAMEKEE